MSAATRRIWVTVVCLLVAVAVVLLGSRWLNGRNASNLTTAPAIPVTVETMPLERLDAYPVTRTFAARVEPRQQADLAFEIPGVLIGVDADEGDRVRQGSVVARIDTRSLNAQQAQQRAVLDGLASDLELADLALQRQQNLEDNGFSAAESLDEARLARDKVDSAIEQARASLNSIEIQIEKSTISAPFDGIVGRRLLDVGATVTPGQSVLTLYDSAPPLIRVGVPPELVPGLHSDALLTLQNGSDTIRASLASVRPDVDGETRTVSVLLNPETGQETHLYFGQLLDLQIRQSVSVPSFPVPLSALREGERGLWSILVVTEDGSELSVAEVSVTIEHANSDTAYVSGAVTPGERVVIGGRHRVVPGEPVQFADPES